MRRTMSSGAWWLSPVAAAIASLAPAVLAVFLCAHQLTLHGVLHGVVVGNESPNLASAFALGRGVLPYSSFALAQPPGMTILMLPFAFLSHVVAQSLAMSLARAATAITTVVAVYLAGFTVRYYGVPASLLAGVFAAVYPLGLFSTAGVTSGPYVLAFTLLGLSVAFSEGRLAEGRRMLVACLFLGYACTIKPWALLPALVVVACAASSAAERRSQLARAAAGVGIGIVVPSVVFLLDAPGAFWHDVVTSELPGHGTMTAGAKLSEVLGLRGAAGIAHPDGLAVSLAVIVMAAIALVAFAGIRHSSTYDWCITAVSIGVVAACFLPGAMSLQYGEFAFPLVGIGVAATVSRLLAIFATSGTGTRSDMTATLARAFAVLLVACAVVVAAVTAPADGGYGARYADSHAIVDTGALTAGIPAAACAVSNNEMVLIAANRFAPDAAACSPAVDPEGLAAVNGSSPAGTARTSEQWLAWLRPAQYVVVASPGATMPASGSVFTYLHADFAAVAASARVVVFRRSRA